MIRSALPSLFWGTVFSGTVRSVTSIAIKDDDRAVFAGISTGLPEAGCWSKRSLPGSASSSGIHRGCDPAIHADERVLYDVRRAHAGHRLLDRGECEGHRGPERVEHSRDAALPLAARPIYGVTERRAGIPAGASLCCRMRGSRRGRKPQRGLQPAPTLRSPPSPPRPSPARTPSRPSRPWD